MEPFRGQYVNTQYSPAFPQPPGSEGNFTYPPNYPSNYSPNYQTPNSPPTKTLLSPHTSEVYSPPYTPQTPEARKTWRWRLRNTASHFWLWETTTCLVSLGIAAAICQQLKALDGESTAYWDYAWSPTSVLALAVTIAKAAMMFPVASAISQLKWHWYRTLRTLEGLEQFDDASRGVLGSLRLLIKLRCWHIASIGAFITICALSIDSLTQNAVRIALIPDHTYDDSYVYRSSRFRGVSSFSQRSREMPSSEMLPPLYYAISAREAPGFEQSLGYCLSGNCTYGTYDSLAVDFQCVQSKTERSDSTYLHAGLKNKDFYLDTTTDIIKSNTTMELPTSGTYQNLGPLIARWLVLVNPSVLRPAPLAMECAFYWTVKKYSSEVVNGVFYENVTSTYTNSTITGTKKEDIFIQPDECWRNNQSLPKTDPNCTNTVGYGAHSSLQAWFRLPDFGLKGFAHNDTRSTDASTYWGYSSIFMQSIMVDLVNANASSIATTINATAERLSSTMTTTLRQMPEVYSAKGNTYGYSNGTTIWSPDVVYDIRWRYMIAPALIVGFSALFFVATVIFTWGEGGWKSSQLAVVFHSLTENDSRALGNIKDYADMREVGRDMHVKLVETAMGKKLVTQKSLANM